MRRTPSLNALRLFRLVARTRSFSETARQANLSQPALSRTIRLLEEELGARLFDRNTRNVALTSSGEALLPVVERLVQEFDGAFADLSQSFAGLRGRVVLGCLPSFAASALPPLLGRFIAERPQIDVVLHETLSGSLYQQMLDRTVDFAVTTPPEPADDAFRFEALIEDPCVLVCRAGDPLDARAPACWAVFAERPFVAMAPSSSVRRLTDAAFIQAGISVRPLFECGQLATLGALIATGLGITALPASTLPMLVAHRLAWRRLEGPQMARTIGIACPAHRSLSPAAEALHGFLRANLDLSAWNIKP